MKKNRFSKETMDLMNAGSMIPACIFVSWLIYKWLNANNVVSEKYLVFFIVFGILTGFYNFFRIIMKVK